MSRKDYKAIAAIIYDNIASDCEETCYQIANRLADIMEKDNPRFDRTRFMTACGF